MNIEALKEIRRTKGQDEADAYKTKRRAFGLRATGELRASRSHLQEALSGEIYEAPEEAGKRPPKVWAGVDPESSSIAVIAGDGSLIAEPLINQPRQVGQGLSFG